MSLTAVPNPTQTLEVDFPGYVQDRVREHGRHMINGVPDYSFSMDLRMRQKLNSLGPVRSLFHSALSMMVPAFKQRLTMKGVQCGPNQYPELYAMGEECARILGTGIPQVFVEYDHAINAYAVAVDDRSSVVCVTSGLLEHMDRDEQMFIMGHEVGHLHNLHSVYNTMGELMMGHAAQVLFGTMAGAGLMFLPAQLVAQIFKMGIAAVLFSWMRCAEISCDRAGTICCGDPKVAQRALAKLASGGIDNVNLEQLRQQVTAIKSSILRFEEWTRTHPLVPKRVEAVHLFAQCETLYGWRPELRGTGTPLTKNDIDARCEKLVSLFDTGYKVDA